jgi:type I site-specific restriction endonuclease
MVHHLRSRKRQHVKPEENTRQKIDQLLVAGGWVIQDHKGLNFGASLGVAVREFPVSTGFADYMLFVDRKAAGLIEAKPTTPQKPTTFSTSPCRTTSSTGNGPFRTRRKSLSPLSTTGSRVK